MQLHSGSTFELANIKWKELGWIVVLVVVVGFPSLFFPFGRDQGIHAYVGSAWLQGQLPFRDVWVQKGPLAYLPHVLVTALFGRTMWGIRLFDLVWQLGCSWLMYIVARRRMEKVWALVSVGSYLVTYFAFGYWGTSHVEGFLLLFVLQGVIFYERARNASHPQMLLFLSGFSVGLAPWFKQTAVVYVAALFVWIAIDYWCWDRLGLRRLLTCWVITASGVLLPSVLIVLVLYAFGMLRPMLDIWRYSFFSYPGMGDTRNVPLLWRTTLDWASNYPLLIFPFLAGTAYLLSSRRTRQDWNGIVALALCGLAGIYVQGRLWNYHWISTLPFMALISAKMIGDGLGPLLRNGISDRRGMIWLLVFVGLGLALPMLRVHGQTYMRLFRYLSDQHTWTEYMSEFGLRDVVQVTNYVQERTTDRDPIFIWGHYSMIYYLADRRNPTRFGMDPPLSLRNPYQRVWQQECMRDLQTHQPIYVLIATEDATPFEPAVSKQQLQDFPEFAAFLRSGYAYDRRIGDFEVYLRVRPPEYPLDARLGEGIVLAGYDLLHENLQPGGVVSLALHWLATSSLETDYTVFVQLVDWSGPDVIAQSDTYPVHGEKPTSDWEPGGYIIDTHDLTLPDDLSAGEYEIIAGMYNLATLERLPTEAEGDTGDYISLGRLVYEPGD